MAERPGLDQVWRQAMEANARYYEALGQVTVDYLKALVGVLGDARLPAVGGGRPAAPARPAPHPEPPQAAMVLEAAAGKSAVGAFMVQNRLSQQVTAPVVASGFLDASGKEAKPALVFEPDVVSLEPGEQVLVRVTAAIDDRLDAGAAYRGEVTIPGLSGDRVPLVVRRTAGAPPARARRRATARRASR
jgi:hypothetical protein